MHKDKQLVFTSQSQLDLGLEACFIVPNPHECYNFLHLIGQTVIIDGNVYKILGIERYLHMSPYKKFEPIGLRVNKSNVTTRDAFPHPATQSKHPGTVP